MSEKTSEFYLRDIIYKNTEKKYIFESTNDNIILKNVHAKNSKIGNGRGIPDLNYLDDLIYICFECKSYNLQKAVKEAKNYILNGDLTYLENRKIYCCGFVSQDSYEIFEYNKEERIFIKKENTIKDLIFFTEKD